MTKRSTNLLLGMMRELQASIERIERDCALLRIESNPPDAEAGGATDAANPISRQETTTYFLDVRFRANEELLGFLADLAEIPQFVSSTVAGTRPGQATVIVELAPTEHKANDAPPTVRCVQCSTTIAFGSQQVSHGLCPACVDDFLRGASE